MKLLTAQYTNFQNHADTKIVFDEVLDIFQGANESGKTVLLDGLKFLFTDKCRDVKMVKDHPMLIKHGEQSAELRCTFSHDDSEYEIRKTISHSGSGAIFYKNGEIKSMKPGDCRAMILSTLGVTEAMLGYLFDAFALSKVSPEDLKKTLQGLFTSGDPEILRQYLIGEIDGLDGTEYMDGILKRYSSGGVEAASKYAIELRVGYKRELRETKEPEKPSIYPSDDEVGLAKKNQPEIQVKGDYFAGEMKNNANQAIRLEGQIDQLEAADRPEQPVKPTLKRISIEKIQEAADEAAMLAEKALVALNEHRSKDTDIGDLPNILEYLRNMGNKISEQSLKAIDNEVSNKTADISRIEAERSKLQDTYDDECSKKLDADKRLIEVVNINENIRSENEIYEAELKDWQVSIENLEKSITEKTKELNTIKIALQGIPLDEIIKTIDELDQQLDEISDLIAAAKQCENYEARIEEISQTKELFGRKIKNWDNICKCLDPKNEKLVALFSKGKSEFDELFNKINASLGLEVSLRADYTFLAKEYGSSDVMQRVSPSRQLRIGAALLIAICNQIGWKTILIDWLDALYGTAREDMIKVLLELKEYDMNTLAFCAGPIKYHPKNTPSWAEYVRPVIDGKVVT